MAELKARRAIKSPKGEQRLESLLEVARDVFSERGFERTTTLEIAQRLSVSEATVFSYFSSKRELCIEVIRRWYDEISSELEREMPALPGVRYSIEYAIRKHLSNLIEKGPGLCALVLSEGRSADEAFMKIIADLQRRYIAPLVRALENSRATGELRRDVPLRLMRDMIYGPMEHVLWSYVTSGRRPDIDKTATQLCDMLWCAFTPPQPDLTALARFRADVAGALRALETPAKQLA